MKQIALLFLIVYCFEFNNLDWAVCKTEWDKELGRKLYKLVHLKGHSLKRFKINLDLKIVFFKLSISITFLQIKFSVTCWALPSSFFPVLRPLTISDAKDDKFCIWHVTYNFWKKRKNLCLPILCYGDIAFPWYKHYTTKLYT